MCIRDRTYTAKDVTPYLQAADTKLRAIVASETPAEEADSAATEATAVAQATSTADKMCIRDSRVCAREQLAEQRLPVLLWIPFRRSQFLRWSKLPLLIEVAQAEALILSLIHI